VDRANIEILTTELADAPHATDNEDNDKEECQVCEQAVDEEHEEDDGIVAGEVAQIVGGPVLSFSKASGFGEEAEVEEFAKWLEVREAGRDGGLTSFIEATGEVEARRQRVYWDGEGGCHEERW